MDTQGKVAVVDLEPFMKVQLGQELTADVKAACDSLAESLRSAGAVVVRDPRCTEVDNNTFLDMMERYFGQQRDEKMKQARPDLHYQVGVTPNDVEKPVALMDPSVKELIGQQETANKAVMPNSADLKWRYMWRVGPRPAETKFQELNAEPVVPGQFPEWKDVMNGWGEKMLAALEVVAQMAALGFGMEREAFTQKMNNAPHLLAPTGSDLAQHHNLNDIFAGFHYDLNFLTIHGKSRFPGLRIWLSDGTRSTVKIPDGCLLVQAGKQMEWLTGGHVQAGWHEVVVTDQTVAAFESAANAGRSTWRISSTVFGHIASDQILEPFATFKDTCKAPNKYPATLAGDQVQEELKKINLAST